MKRWIGIILIVAGCLWLLADYIWSLSKYNINALLVVPFLFIILGAVIHVLFLKKESKY